MKRFKLHQTVIPSHQASFMCIRRFSLLLCLCLAIVFSATAQEKRTFEVNGVSFTMVYVEGGTFTMGATSEQEDDAQSWEKPAHEVSVKDYYIGETEVTQLLWEAVMMSNPSYFNGSSEVSMRCPVDRVTWDDCQEFIRRLNVLTGERFRLPTEAEWEYAARGGCYSKGYKYSGSDDPDNCAWYIGNSYERTQPVACLQRNELGLFDMSGNVWEWCQDWYGKYSSEKQNNPTGPDSGSERVIRGGGWYFKARECRVSYRNSSEPSFLTADVGLRLAL